MHMNQLTQQTTPRNSVYASQFPFRARARNAGRFDLYRNIHKSLRALLGETLVKVGQLDSYNTEQLATVLGQVRAMAHFCETKMAQGMDRPNVPPSMLAARTRHVSACRQIVLIADTTQSAGASLRPALVEQLYCSIVRFIADTLAHMQAEEKAHSNLLWQAQDEQSLMDIEHGIAVLLAANESRCSLRWTLPAMDPAARLSMLSAARMGMPLEVFDDMLDSVKYFLPCGEWNRLMARLYSGQRMAA